MNISLLVFFLCLKNFVESAKILVAFPIPAPSHYILGSALVRSLVEKGHDVTFISSFSEKNPPKGGKFREVVLTGFYELAQERRKVHKLFDQENANVFFTAIFMNKMLLESTERTLNHTNVQKLLNSDEKFDLVIIEQFMNDALKGFADHYKAPLILFSTIGTNAWVNLLVGNPAPTSYIPSLFLSYSSDMNFWERTINCLMYVLNEGMNRFYAYPTHAKLVKQYFPNGGNLYNYLYNVSVFLINSHPSTNQPVPYVPSMIDIGGFHIKPSNKLPQDLQQFLDNAKDGAIFFSLGSNLKSSDLPPEKRDIILRIFGKLKQKIMWKWEEKNLPGQPNNVKISDWFPQQDILAHPNLKLFMTHGGLLSTSETIYHGVPVLAIPIFGDQKINAQNIVNAGFGLYLGYRDITEESLSEKLNQLLNDPKYANNAKKRSEIFHDRQNKPLDTAIYWVEYVLRHKGAPHLRVAAVDVPLYQYFLLDVVLVWSGVLVLAIYLFWKLGSAVCRRKDSKVKQN